jgi:hypothetical protein
MRLNKSEYRAIYDGLGCIHLWALDDGTLVWTKMGIRSKEYHPKVNIASGRVDEGWQQPDFVDIQPLDSPTVRHLIVVAPDGLQEVRDVIVAENVKIMPATKEEMKTPLDRWWITT